MPLPVLFWVGVMVMMLRRVFILYNSPLFARGLGALLSQVAGLEVVGMAPAGPEPPAWEEIQQLAPDVVLLQEEEVTPIASVPNALPGAQLITFSLNHDRVRIYGFQDIQRGGLEGVLDAMSRVYEEAAGTP